MVITQPSALTADQLLSWQGDPDKRYELVDGEIITMAPPGGEHGEITFKSGHIVGIYVEANRLGKMYAAETGFLLRRNPDRVRAPDFAFIAAGRLPGDRSPKGYIEIAPDFVIEVVSPNDTADDVQTRVEDWLNAGATVVWTIYPTQKSVLIWHSLDRAERRTGEDELDAEPAIPGFRCPASTLFPR